MKKSRRCWAVCLLLVVSGCVSAQSARQMTGFELIRHHQNHVAFWGDANMALVDELHRRGAITDKQRAEYSRGARLAIRDPGSPSPLCTPLYDFGALGYSVQEVLNFYGGSGSGGSTIYTRHGSVTVHDLGGGSYLAQ